MKIKNYLYFLLAIGIIISSCKPDDPEFSPVADRDRGEQQVEDKEALETYLGSHYYNSQFLADNADATIQDIVITELAEGEEVPDGHTILFSSPDLIMKSTNYEGTEYDYYFLRINQGGGEASPNFVDKVRVNYEGSLITDGSVFDSSVSPLDFDLVGFSEGIGTIRGWQLVIPEFNVASNFEISETGDINYNEYGFGIMFIPSGLAYFSSSLVGITSYSNLIFKFELLQTEENDHDNDGIPSYLEDLGPVPNIDVFDDDTDEDGIPNYVDIDDDGDGVLTINELSPQTYTQNDAEENFMSENEAQDYFNTLQSDSEFFVSIVLNSETLIYELRTLKVEDTNDNSIPDYLEEEVIVNYNE